MGCGSSVAGLQQKTIHCKMPDGQLVSVHISTKETREAVTSALLSACGKNKPGCSLTLKNSNGVIMIPSGALPANRRESPYLVDISCSQSGLKGISGSQKSYPVLLKQTFITTRSKTDLAQQKCTSNGLRLSEQSLVSSVNKYYGLDQSDAVSLPLYRKYKASPETIDQLKSRDFDPRMWTDDELVFLMHVMYSELKLIETFAIEPIVLHQFLTSAKDQYQGNPFHNFRHSFCVTQMMYHMIHHFQLDLHYTELELLILLTACVCHDMDHPGFTNSFLIHSNHPLAVQFDNQSPLENHHTSLATELVCTGDTNILSSLSEADSDTVRMTVRDLIMATDMAHHKSIMKEFSSITDHFLFEDEHHMRLLMKILIKSADLSNELRPNDIAAVWLDCLLAEYFKQGDIEKERGMPVGPVMDRDKVRRGSCQVFFINTFMMPMFQQLLKVFPQTVSMINKLEESLQYYTKMSESEQQSQKVSAGPKQTGSSQPKSDVNNSS